MEIDLKKVSMEELYKMSDDIHVEVNRRYKEETPVGWACQECKRENFKSSESLFKHYKKEHRYPEEDAGIMVTRGQIWR